MSRNRCGSVTRRPRRTGHNDLTPHDRSVRSVRRVRIVRSVCTTAATRAQEHSPPMARRSSTAPPEDFEEHIVDVDVRDEMRSSYLEYAYSVIYSRALPDARDGLKPVQRR